MKKKNKYSKRDKMSFSNRKTLFQIQNPFIYQVIKWAIIIFVLFPIAGNVLLGLMEGPQQKTNPAYSVETSGYMYDDSNVYKALSKLDWDGETKSVTLFNNNNNLTNRVFEGKSHVSYSDLDELNRAGRATAYLTKDNLGKSEGRQGQKWQPTGWRQKQIDGKYLLDRGHLIAYTLTFNLNEDGQPEQGRDGSIDNPKNLFTQTAQSNQGEMTKYEGIVRKELEQGNEVVYQVTPIFEGDDLMAKGVWLEMFSSSGNTFNTFVFNVTNDITYDYETGASKEGFIKYDDVRPVEEQVERSPGLNETNEW